MSFLGGLGNLGAAVGGYENEQARAQKLQQEKMQTQALQDDKASMEALGRAFGAPVQNTSAQAQQAPPAPPPVAPQQAPPQPMPPRQPQPGGPPMQFAGGGAPAGLPAGAGPPQAAAPQPQPQVRPQPQAQAAPGQMNLEQLTKRIIAANPGIERNPRVLIGALTKGQTLLGADGRQELAQAKMDLATQVMQAKIDQAQQKLDQSAVSIEDKRRGLQEANQMKLQLEQLRQSGASSRSTEKVEAALTMLITKLAHDTEKTATTEAGKDSRLATTEAGKGERQAAALGSKEKIAEGAQALKKELGEGALTLGRDKLEQSRWYQSRITGLKEQGLADAAAKAQADHELKQAQEQGKNERASQAEAGKGARVETQQEGATERTKLQQEGANARAKTMNLGKLTAMATKAGVQITDEMDVDAIQKATADKIATTAASKKMDPDTVQFMAQSIVKDPSLISRIGRNDDNRKAILDALAKQPGIDSGTLASAKVALGEKVEAGRVVGRVEGATRQALEEMAPFSKLVRSSANKVDNTKYPTVNSILQAAKRGTGDPDVVSLANNIQALKRAFTQAMARGGQSSVDAQRRADELISPTMAPKQLDAAIKAMEAEAGGILGATGRATSGIAAEAGGKAAPPAEESEPVADPAGIR